MNTMVLSSLILGPVTIMTLSLLYTFLLPVPPAGWDETSFLEKILILPAMLVGAFFEYWGETWWAYLFVGLYLMTMLLVFGLAAHGLTQILDTLL